MDLAIFIGCCLALIPLARVMGQATEVLANRMGSAIGGLLSATFGNAAELILGLAALRAGHIDVVKASLTGSILGNMLLITGASMLAGGLKQKKQTFSATAVLTGVSLMFVAAAAMAVPTLFAFTQPGGRAAVQAISDEISVVLLLAYGLNLLFTLKTHAYLYTEDTSFADHGHGWSVRRALISLIVATVATAVVSEVLVHNLDVAIGTLGLSPVFVGIMILATVGNAAEHASAITMAMKDRIGLSFSIAFESSKQIALFVAPVLVLAGLAMGQKMDLVFTPIEILAIALGVGSTALIAIDGESNWLEGAMLLILYVILGITFFFVR